MDYSLEEIKKRPVKNIQTGNLATLRKGLTTGTSLQDRIESMSTCALPQAAQQLKEAAVDLTFIFDRSSSCYGTEEATIQGFNNLINLERKKGFPTTVTTVLFDDNFEYIHRDNDINKVNSFTYKATGCTALYDTICTILKTKISTFNHSKKNIIVIMTDGSDVSSKQYNNNDTKRIIKRCYDLGFEFILLGTNINAKDLAASLGININNAENYSVDPKGILINFQAVSRVLDSVRENGTIAPDWSRAVRSHLALTTNSENNNNGPVLKLGRK